MAIRLDILTEHSSIFQELCDFRGSLLPEWLEAWHRLSASERDPFTHPLWVTSWLKHLSPQEQSSILLYVLRDEERLLGILSFETKQHFMPFGRFSYLKTPLMAWLASSPALPAESCIEALALITDTPSPTTGDITQAVRFLRVDATNHLLQTEFHVCHRPHEARMYLSLKDGFASVWGNLKGKYRRNLNRHLKNAKEMGTLCFETIREPVALNRAFEELVEMETQGWKANSPHALQNETTTRDLLRSFIQVLCDKPGWGQAVIQRMMIADSLAATRLDFIHDSTLYAIKTVYNEAFKRVSPSNLLLRYSLEEFCAVEKIHTFNILSSTEWFSKWQPEQIATYDVFVFPPGWKGKAQKAAICLCGKKYKSGMTTPDLVANSAVEYE